MSKYNTNKVILKHSIIKLQDTNNCIKDIQWEKNHRNGNKKRERKREGGKEREKANKKKDSKRGRKEESSEITQARRQ